MAVKYYWFFLLFLSSTLLGGDHKSENSVLLDKLSAKISKFSRHKKYSTNTKVMIVLGNMYSFNDSFIKVKREILFKALREVLSEIALIETHLAFQKVKTIKDKGGQKEKISLHNPGYFLSDAQEAGKLAQDLIQELVLQYFSEKLPPTIFFSNERHAYEYVFSSYFPQESKDIIKAALITYFCDYLCEKDYFKSDIGDFIYSINGYLYMRKNPLLKNCQIEHLALIGEAKLEEMIMAKLVKENNLFEIKKSVFSTYNKQKIKELYHLTPHIKDIRGWRYFQEKCISSDFKNSLNPWLSALDELLKAPYIIFLLGQSDKLHKDIATYIIILALNL